METELEELLAPHVRIVRLALGATVLQYLHCTNIQTLKSKLISSYVKVYTMRNVCTLIASYTACAILLGLCLARTWSPRMISTM